ncbi:MAG: peptidylprolyl isomerase [Anaerolineae bacterium]|nr:peptidylprolyl isomerase [Anaerolineae bacterium]MCX8068161.1 peptidylprolyl isomerase [Anaerolineae bacterium]MDW7991473.1 peptidylprolyl isomerase [Anaerolineae bacterium]
MRRFLPLAAAVTLILVACARGATPTSNVPTASPPPTSTPTPISSRTPATCQAVPSPFASLQPINVPPVTDADWAQGPASAPVTLIEYSDFQCPACARMESLLRLLKEGYGDQIRIVYRHFPLISIHDKAQITAEAAEAAGVQGKFWEMHNLLFERQGEWASLPTDQMPQVLAGYARELGLDVERFTRDLGNHTFQAKVMEQYRDATAMGLSGTPSFIVNGRFVPNNGYLPTLVDEILARPPQYDPPAMQVDPARRYTVTLRTPRGDIGIELYPNHAPVTVNSFLFLARKAWYNETALFRWSSDFVVQSGDPAGVAFRSPGFQCSTEISDLGFNEPGIVGMLGPSPDVTNGRFFITLTAIPNLNGKYTAIGKVVKGLDVLRSIPENEQALIPPSLKIQTVQIEEH